MLGGQARSAASRVLLAARVRCGRGRRARGARDLPRFGYSPRPGDDDAAHAWNQPHPGRGRTRAAPPRRRRPTTVDLDLTDRRRRPSARRPRSASRCTRARRRRPSPTSSARPSTRSRSTARRSTRPTVYADSRIALDDLAARQRAAGRRATAPTATPARACTASSTRSTTASTSTRSSRSPDARRVYTTFEQPDLKALVHLHGHRARALEGRLQRRRPPSREPAGDGIARWALPADRADVDVHHRARRRRVPRGPRHLRRQARRDPARPLLPPVAGRAPRRRRAGRGHQAGLRVLRGRLRLPLPVRQVRPALRAGVQHGRDGERRLRDAARRVPPPQPPGALRSTSSAPTRSCTRWRTCGSATSSR